MSFFLFFVFVFLIKNLFLIDLSAFYFLIFSVISMIQFSASLEDLFSDFLKSASFIFLFITDLSVFAFLIFFLVNMLMCFQCSKILRFDALIQCIRSNKYVKCTHYSIKKIVCLIMSLLSRHKLFIVNSSKFFLSFSSNCYKFKS